MTSEWRHFLEQNLDRRTVDDLVQDIVRDLRRLMRNRPTREKIIQERIEDILTIWRYEFQREVWIRYAGIDYRADFMIPNLYTIIEVKLCRKKKDLRSIVRAMNGDKLAYLSQCQRVIFIVYDFGHIRDRSSFEGQVEAGDNRIVCRVVPH